ncbi:unnamed protein product [Oikopleura dioica]|uniref:G-protein coupled receptors family 1 profile domain-containing protein n=1 Tax=Oikopleura dioica TaxID=34765 RepID=E4X191_OIKDI|nr:unnamed protein product [Oikopleura dioica]
MSLDRFFLIVGSPALFSRPRELFQKYTNLICLLAWMFSIFWCIPLFIWYTVNPRTSQVSLQLDGQIKSTNWSSWDIPQANKLDIGELCGVHLGSSINSFLQSSFFKENCGESIVEHLKFEKCEKLQCEIVENFNIDAPEKESSDDLFDSYEDYPLYDAQTYFEVLKEKRDCFFCVKAYNDYLICVASICFFVPLILMTICYILICTKLQETSKRVKFARSKEARKRFDLRKRVILMIIVILASFVICWLPFHIDKLIEVANYEKSKNDASFYLAESFSNYRSDKVPCSRSDFQFKENSPSSGLKTIAELLIFFNAALNPFIYTFMSSQFKEDFLKATKCLSVRFDQTRNSFNTKAKNLQLSFLKKRFSSTESVTFSNVASNRNSLQFSPDLTVIRVSESTVI